MVSCGGRPDKNLCRPLLWMEDRRCRLDDEKPTSEDGQEQLGRHWQWPGQLLIITIGPVELTAVDRWQSLFINWQWPLRSLGGCQSSITTHHIGCYSFLFQAPGVLINRSFFRSPRLPLNIKFKVSMTAWPTCPFVCERTLYSPRYLCPVEGSMQIDRLAFVQGGGRRC